MALSFQSEALGRLDLRLEVGGSARARGRRGAAGAARTRSPTPPRARLQDGLHARTGLEADVRVTPRREPLDLYA